MLWRAGRRFSPAGPRSHHGAPASSLRRWPQPYRAQASVYSSAKAEAFNTRGQQSSRGSIPRSGPLALPPSIKPVAQRPIDKISGSAPGCNDRRRGWRVGPDSAGRSLHSVRRSPTVATENAVNWVSPGRLQAVPDGVIHVNIARLQQVAARDFEASSRRRQRNGVKFQSASAWRDGHQGWRRKQA